LVSLLKKTLTTTLIGGVAIFAPLGWICPCGYRRLNLRACAHGLPCCTHFRSRVSCLIERFNSRRDAKPCIRVRLEGKAIRLRGDHEIGVAISHRGKLTEK